MTKQDRQLILGILDSSLNCDQDTKECTWVDALQMINKDALYRSIAQVLNAEFDGLPNDTINMCPRLVEIANSRKNMTVMDVLSSTNTVFRFAPAPSGYLHIGHFVPLLLNILLRSVSKHCGNRSEIIFRIDDTNPNDDDYSTEIKHTMMHILGDSFNEFIETRSSVLAPKVIDLIEQSILAGDDKFYVDLSPKDVINLERSTKTNSVYRDLPVNEVVDMWRSLKTGVLKDAVVRAKIDMTSDNGNLRDPVMLRYVKVDSGAYDCCKYVLMPTYDLVCPVLDALDGSRDDTILIALRDCNYYDRLDQYYWIQRALKLKQTAVLTFSRVNFENVLLSKRKIKKLIESGTVTSWSDPRLMTMDGVFNRGMTLLGLLNFYWLTGHISAGNRSTSQDVDSLFSINDKVLSQRNNFIMDRMPVDFSPIDQDDHSRFMIVTVYACVQKKNTKAAQTTENVVRNKTQFLSNVKTTSIDYADPDESVTVSDQDLIKIPDRILVNRLFCKKDRLITCNLRNIMDLVQTHGLSSPDLDNGSDLIKRYGLTCDKFKVCSDIKVGETVKINNFKDLSSEPVFAGYYIVTRKGMRNVNDISYDGIDVMFIN